MQEPAENQVIPPPQEGGRFGGRGYITPIAILLVILVAYFLIQVQSVLILLVMALLLATILERPVSALEARHVPRPLGIFLMYLAIFGAIGALVVLIAPAISHEVSRFRTDVPTQLVDLQTAWATGSNAILKNAGVDGLQKAIDALDNPPAVPENLTLTVLSGFGGGLIGTVTVFVVAFYYLMEREFLRRLIISQLPPATGIRVARIWDDVETKVGRWMRGQLTLCLIIGLASLVGYGLMGIRFWPLLALFAGITEAIPIVGPWLGGIPAVVIALTMGWDKALMVIAFVAVLQALENWVLVPRVMKGAVGLTPLTVFVAILVGQEYRGVVGALLAIPIAAAVQVVVADVLKSRRLAHGIEERSASRRWLRQGIAEPAAPVAAPTSVSPPPVSTSDWTGRAMSQAGQAPVEPDPRDQA